MDSKGPEYDFVAGEIRRQGHDVLIIDVGTLDPPTLSPDISRDEVLATLDPSERPSARTHDRGFAVAAMSKAAPIVVERLAREGRIDGILALGGSGGTAIATAAMRALPIGFPKFMVSTLAGGSTAHYIGVKDIVMMPSIVDVAGLNQISKQLFAQAAHAICGMAEAPRPDVSSERPLIAASMFGNTTACVQRAKALLEEEGFEVLVFHASGSGGRTMESLIASGRIAGVLDITTTEWADELMHGVFSAGQERLEAAARNGIPAIVAPGCLDMVNFHAPDTVPETFLGRTFYEHNPQVTLMRTNKEECRQLGKILAEKLNLSTGSITVLLPLRGLSVISEKGGPFYDPEADAALFQALKTALREDIPVIECDAAINDEPFATACAQELLRLIRQEKKT